MFCSKCGRLITDGARFCSGCGRQIKTEVVENMNQCDGSGVFPGEKTETAETETAESDYSGDVQADGSCADYGYGYGNRKKRSTAAIVVCTLFSIVLTLIVSGIVTAIILGSSITSCMPEKLFESAFGGIKCSEIQIGYLLDKSEGYDNDTTLAEYVYDKMDDEQKDRLKEEDIADIIDDTTIGKYILSTADKYVEVVCGERDEISVKKEDIISLIEENEELIEEIRGRELTKSEYKKIEKLIDESGVEKISLSKEDIYGGSSDVIRFSKLMTGVMITVVLNAVLGIAALFFIFIIFLLNQHKPRLVCIYSGFAVLFAGLKGLLCGVGAKMLVDYFEGQYGKYSMYNVFKVYMDSLTERLFLIGAIALAVAVVLFIINAVLKHREKKNQYDSWERGMGNV